MQPAKRRNGAAVRSGDAPAPGHDRIRVAAVRLFTRNGYEATSMKQLALELGMAPANLYNYYPNKQAILLGVVTFQLRGVLDRQEEALAKFDDPVSRVRAFAYDLVLNDLKDPLAAYVGHHGLNGLKGAARTRMSRMMSKIRGYWIDEIRRGVELGHFDTPDPKLSALSALTLCSYVSSWYTPGQGYEPEQVAAHTAASVLRTVGYPEPLPA